jgi:hypothetical protein
MRTFEDRAGASWTARVHEDEGYDYKGRYFLVLEAGDAGLVSLTDVRWNSEGVARRALDTMSVSELCRRLRTAVGRGAVHLSA